LNTSGSTGSPKLVRLSRENLQANAQSIAAYLNLSPGERPITSLPMSYSYGLSVMNSHLLAGGCLVLTDHGILRREFWGAVDRHSCTSLAGVPYTYQMLLKTGLLNQQGASLRTLTQAGGALAPDDIRRMHRLARERGFRFFVMYGQTEATARISYVPFDALASHIGSIGMAIPGGSLEIDSVTGELVYRGPNVMLGYAQCREDLAKGDEIRGILRTGDLARTDEDGFFYITGRRQRFLKLFGKRFNLDEVEQIVYQKFRVPVACFGQDDLLRLAIEGRHSPAAEISEMLRQTFNLPAQSIRVETVDQLPRTAHGKTDYQGLTLGRAQVAASPNAAPQPRELTRP
jgi:long-chain acyl-CoA synthetase